MSRIAEKRARRARKGARRRSIISADDVQRIRDEEAVRQKIRDERDGRQTLFALTIMLAVGYLIWRWWGSIVDGWFA